MAEFKVVISDPQSGKSEQVDIKGEQANRFLGLSVGSVIDGSLLGKKGLKLKITGGSGRAGEPMKRDIGGGVKRMALLSKPPCYHPKERGCRRRKFVRGNTVTDDIVQINTTILRGE